MARNEPRHTMYWINGQKRLGNKRYWEIRPDQGAATGKTFASMEDFPADVYDKVDEHFHVEAKSDPYKWEEKNVDGETFWVLRKK